MSETLTMSDAAPEVNEAGLNAAEQEALEIAEGLESGDGELLAGKFKDTQSLEQAYLELQKKLGEPKEDVRNEERVEETEAPEEVTEPEDDEAPSETLSEQQAQELFKMVGGEKAYKSMIEWAGQNFSKQEVEMYDSVMGKGDPNSIFFAVQALFNRYSEATGSDGQLLTGRSASKDSNGFRSQSELVAAMSDPRYDRDPAYRRDVMTRLENSDIDF
jgi:hypothetical protein